MHRQIESSVRDSYRHDGVVAEMQARHAIPRAAAEALFDDLALFLAAAACAPVEVIPSASIDDAWHSFILHTADYAAYCESRFGQFLHHQPVRPTVDHHPASTTAEREVAGRSSRDAVASIVGSLRPPGWPHHRGRALLSQLADPLVQEIVITLLDDMDARKRYLESPLGWLGERRGALDHETHLLIYDFFGGALRHLRDWPGITDRVYQAALAALLDDVDPIPRDSAG